MLEKFKLNYNHNYHLVNLSPWPLMSAFSVMIMLMSMVNMFQQKFMMMLFLSMMITMIIMFQWWRDVVRESTFQGLHSINVIKGMKMGMILFIISEIFFFFSFFWSFFHLSLSQLIDLGMKWPPTGIKVFNPFLIPLLNTIILLTSGITITWAHHSMINNNFKQFMMSMMITIILAIYFSMLQMYEYMEANFNISDSSYGSIFFMSTGFHGIHVLIGTTFLMVCFFRFMKMNFNNNHHFGFESAAWYWHFVDIVWLFLYLMIYWWGN